ncbi:MAG: aspartate aminotransferase family protein [bacterium]|nr:aspartate aminotransferase family protein [Candidatus Sumerlaeota bacterium]
MDSLLDKIYSLSQEERDDCRKHVMLGGGTPGPTMVKGKGIRLQDVDGKSYIDCTSQSWAMYLGFSHPEIVGIIKDHAENLTHIHQGFDTLTRLYLAREISRICPPGFNRVSFTVGGGPAIEAAMKVAFLNRPGTQAFISQYDSYHGTTLTAMSASWHSTKASGSYMGGSHFLPLLMNFARFPNPYLLRLPIPGKHEYPDVACAEVLRTIIERGINGPPTAVIVEPLQASAGQIPATKAYLQKVREICDEYGAILIFDEIQTLCRIGRFTAAEYYGVDPDIIVFGKGLGGGLPLACIVIRDGLKGFGHDVQELHTFASPTLSHVTSAKMIEIVRRDNLLENTRRIGAYIAKNVESMRDEFPEVAETRQAGLHIGVEFARPDAALTPMPAECVAIRDAAIKRGCIFGLGGVRKQVLKIKPPLITTQNEADTILSIFHDCAAEILRAGKPRAAASSRKDNAEMATVK